MDDDAPLQMRWPRVLARVVGYPLLAVVFYFVSAGPVAYVFSGRRVVPDRALEQFFAPISWLNEHGGLPSPMLSYYRWWYRLPGGPHERILRESPPLPAVNDPGPAEPLP